MSSVIAMQRKAKARKDVMDVLAAQVDEFYKTALACKSVTKRGKLLIAAEQVRKELFAARMFYDEVMVELYGTTHKRVVTR